MSPKGKTAPFSLSHKTPALQSQGVTRFCKNYQPHPRSLPRRGKKKKGESENLGRYTLALPMTLCLTCNQNNSNPVTVCISAKFLNFSSRQQALGMTGCLSDSSGTCQSPSSEATGKLNASEQGHSYTFPLCTRSILIPHPGSGVEDPGMYAEEPRPVPKSLTGLFHPSVSGH